MGLAITVLIPVYQPDSRLVDLVSAYAQAGLSVLVVDDGSTDACEYFEEAARVPGVEVIRTNKNYGKGESTKRGIEHLVKHASAGTEPAIITASMFRQHSVEDVLAVKACLEANPHSLVLGVRDVDHMKGSHGMGNRITRTVTKALYGVAVSDAQTSLRGFSLWAADKLLAMRGKRYDYDMSILLGSGEVFESVEEVPVQVSSDKEHYSRPFRPVRDSARIYAILLRHFPKFIMSSFSSYLVDYLLFSLLYAVVGLWAVWATVLARVFSASMNYAINRYFVFGGQGKRYTPLRFFTLAACILAASSLSMAVLSDVLGLPGMVVKPVVDLLLYFVNFTVQTNFAKKE